jgi:1,4-alpha-glucan branching enzyme
MSAFVSLLLHAHLPFVRHPEHERFLEESWLYEAITECYLPLVRVFRGWHRDRIDARLTLTLSPTLCAMLKDPLLCGRYERRLEELVRFAERETIRNLWEPEIRRIADFYFERFHGLQQLWRACDGDLVAAFRELQELGLLEIIPTAATHALLPLLSAHPSSIRAQVLTARDDYRRCHGRDPVGIWLPECAYSAAVEDALFEAGFRWFVLDAPGVLNAKPRPRHGIFAPVFTPQGLAAFGREPESAEQVWSRDSGYPGDGRYRDFYRDVGFDLEFDYVRPVLPSPDHRGFTGIKYHRIGMGADGEKALYRRADALQAAEEHALHFIAARREHIQHLVPLLGQPPILLCPYDAELFGHWWYEGPEFLDLLMRKAGSWKDVFRCATPTEYLETYSTHQVTEPAESSWGEQGFYRVWLNETNAWIVPHLNVAMERMHRLARQFPDPDPLQRRALNQAGRELLLAQASDWPFILHTGTSPSYARERVTQHLLRFSELYEQLSAHNVDPQCLEHLESIDNLFPDVDYRAWATP